VCIFICLIRNFTSWLCKLIYIFYCYTTNNDFEKAYDSVRRELLYNILTEFSILHKLVRLTEMCLNDTYSKVRVNKNLSEAFPHSEWSETWKCFIVIAFQLCFNICHKEDPKKIMKK
jgi:hypothetical protein